VLLQPAIEFGGTPVGLEERGSRLGGSQRGPDDEAVGGASPLPC